MRIFVLLMTIFSGGWAAPQPKKINWSPCFKKAEAEFGLPLSGPYFCSVVNVPLDYSQPNGPAVSLSVLRVPARGEKVGSIFLNPGGPGGSGVILALIFGLLADQFWGPEIRDKFDLIGVDPRGIGRSTGIKCFGNVNQAFETFPPFDFPLTAEDEMLVEELDSILIGNCGQRGNKIGYHMSTANVARDMDTIREALGEDQLNFIGLSYGSYLGTVYANLFPDRVRAIVIDGVLSPEAWLNKEGEIPSTTRLQSAKGAQDSLDRFLELCEKAMPGNCALADGDESPSDRFDALAAKLLTEEEPRIAEIFGMPTPVNYQFLIGLTLGGLYNPFSFPDLAKFISNIEAAAPIEEIVPAAETIMSMFGFGSKRNFPNYPSIEGFQGVLCTDSNNPTDYSVWSQAGADADKKSYFGRLWTWGSSACSSWPYEDAGRYEGDFKTFTANPILIVGNAYDPATPNLGAEAAASLIPNHFRIKADISGHTALGSNTCVDLIIKDYLLDPQLTADGRGPLTHCPDDFDNIFDVLAQPPSGGEVGNADLRAELMAQIAYKPFFNYTVVSGE